MLHNGAQRPNNNKNPKEEAQKLNLLSQLHARKVKKAFKSFGAIRIKIPFLELYKERTICAIFRVNTPIWVEATKAKTCCAEAQ